MNCRNCGSGLFVDNECQHCGTVKEDKSTDDFYIPARKTELKKIKGDMGVFKVLKDTHLKGDMNVIHYAENCIIKGDMNVIRKHKNITVTGDMNSY